MASDSPPLPPAPSSSPHRASFPDGGSRSIIVPADRRLKDFVLLCVAADTDSLEALFRVLRPLPCKVLMTNVPAQALRWVESERVNVVLSDQWLEDRTGSRLLKEVKNRVPSTARFLLAASPDAGGEIGTADSAVHGVIETPWDGAALRRTLLAILWTQEERSREPLPMPGPVGRGKRARTDHGDERRPSLA